MAGIYSECSTCEIIILLVWVIGKSYLLCFSTVGWITERAYGM